jgi:parallel beta-helix repeat protein
LEGAFDTPSREDRMRQPAALFPIALALGAATLLPGRGAQAEPTVITACQTLGEGSYVLANDIQGASDTCLTIPTSFVTIDLAGFRVGGNRRGIATRPDPEVTLVGITVRNGLVFGTDFAVFLGGADGSIVEGLHASSLFGTAIAAEGIVRGNTVFGGRGEQPGISASGVVIDNYVNGLSGVGVGIAASGTVRGNTAIGNRIGIVVSAGSTVIGNTATGNAGIGIQAACPSNLTDNTAVNNGTNLVLNGDGCHNEDNVAP